MGTDLRGLLPVLSDLSADRRRDLPLDTVGRLAALSPHHLQRTFRRVVGESPKRYQLRLRLERAATLLTTGDRPVIEVAFDCGFNSHETFTRAFTRHFGRSPRDYRRRAGTGGRTVGPDPVELVARTGPCITLYRAPIDHPRPAHPETRSAPHPMSHQIEIKTLAETPILFIRRRVDVDEIADQLAEMLPAVYGYVMEAGLTMGGPPVVRYAEQSPAFSTLEAGIPLAEPAEAPVDRDGIQAGTLPGGEAAATVHTGPYDTLGQAHAAIDRWLAANDRVAAGAPWEVYLTDPGEVPDPAQWQTEVVWPLAP